jgi:carbon starvation protein CstA
MRKLFLTVAVLFTAAVVLQLYFAAVGVFSNPEDELFNWHGTNGRIVLPILAILLIITAALARAGKRTIWLSVLPLVLLLFQTVLFILTGAIFGLDEHTAPLVARGERHRHPAPRRAVHRSRTATGSRGRTREAGDAGVRRGRSTGHGVERLIRSP